jgi:large subunit ribosomal protein L16
MFFSGPRKIKLKSFKFSRKKISKEKVKKPILKFGSFGLVSLSFNRITLTQLEAARKVLRRLIKKEGKIVINILPQNPLTKKPLQSRMGKGKGAFKL